MWTYLFSSNFEAFGSATNLTDWMQYETYINFHRNLGDSSRSRVLDVARGIRESSKDMCVQQKLDAEPKNMFFLEIILFNRESQK